MSGISRSERNVTVSATLKQKRSSSERNPRRFQLEPLEDRKMLTAGDTNAAVAQNWVDVTATSAGTVAVGDTTYLKGAADPSHAGESFLVLGPDNGFNEYGVDDFGAVTSIGHVDGATGDVVINSAISATTVAGEGLIHDAIENMAATGGQTVSILAGTYKESDIVIDRPLTLKGATSTTNPGPSQTLVNLVTIEPDVASVHGDANFPSGSHQGIIVNSPSVTVQSLTIDGNGNGSLAGSFNYQAGITTLFDMQAGGDYLAEHNQAGPVRDGPWQLDTRDQPRYRCGQREHRGPGSHGQQYLASWYRPFGRPLDNLQRNGRAIRLLGQRCRGGHKRQ